MLVTLIVVFFCASFWTFFVDFTIFEYFYVEAKSFLIEKMHTHLQRNRKKQGEKGNICIFMIPIPNAQFRFYGTGGKKIYIYPRKTERERAKARKSFRCLNTSFFSSSFRFVQKCDFHNFFFFISCVHCCEMVAQKIPSIITSKSTHTYTRKR